MCNLARCCSQPQHFSSETYYAPNTIYIAGVHADHQPSAAAVRIGAPWAFALTTLFAIVAALGSIYLGIIRLLQARRVLRYQANLRRLPHYTMTSAEMPISNERLFIARGFRWTQKHTQRLTPECCVRNSA